MSTSESFAVSMMIGTCERVRISRHTSVPDSPGSIRSSSTRSAPSRSNAASASPPSAATVDLVALPLQQVGERLAERGLVLDEQDAGHTRSFSRRPGRPISGAGVSGSRMVKVEPRPRRDQTRTSPPWFCDDVLDDAEAEAGAAGVAGARLVDAVEPLEHAVEVLLGDPDALVGHRDLDDAVAGPRRRRRRASRSRRVLRSRSR